MSKELEALYKIANAEMKEQYKATKNGFMYRVISDEYSKELKTIEKALKKLEELEKAFDSLSKDDEKAKKLLSLEIEKNRALDIIKRCKDVISLDKEYDEELYTQEEIEKEGGQKYYLEDGSDGYRKHKLTQEEYDLLKEVLL